ncbi:hypothetical protein BDV26DRAFT_285760 [Aspergillus bertholletiae]|uniref:Uncharacterized protein n=1 Tax=Aspergillus bertholletiae TaxID=1226010 RepID=A0A5N7AV62_9EURO|nr:hypothetical protein BDV26DRAFT_285760 [Aspergillus bertholletiae]
MGSTRVYTNDSDRVILGLYGIFIIYHGLNQGKIYRPHHPALIWHILSGTLEVILYYGDFNCSIAAVVACWVHSYTSLTLVKGLPNGYPPHTRPAYQAGSIMRTIQVVRAYYTQNPMDYHDSMMPLHGFVYTRALIFLLGTMGPTRSFVQNVNSPFVYAESVLGAALISVSHCHGSWPVLVYLTLMHLLGKISLWISEDHESRKESGLAEPILIKTLRWAGFVMHKVPPNSRTAPLIGYLPMDNIGDRWAKQ